MRFPLPLLAALLGLLVAGLPAARGQQLAPGGMLAPPPNNPPVFTVPVNGTATIRYKSFEGGFYALEADEGLGNFDPLDRLPADFEHDGLRVRFAGRIRFDYASTHQFGQILELTSLTKLMPFAGAYAGTVRRLTADGQRQDSYLRLLVSEDGTVFGTLGLFLPGRLSPLYLLGKVDQNGAATFKTRIADPSGSELILPDPDAEKMPLLFLRDGRVLGGALDRNGVSLTLRAQLLPPNSGPPVPPPGTGF